MRVLGYLVHRPLPLLVVVLGLVSACGQPRSPSALQHLQAMRGRWAAVSRLDSTMVAEMGALRRALRASDGRRIVVAARRLRRDALALRAEALAMHRRVRAVELTGASTAVKTYVGLVEGVLVAESWAGTRLSLLGTIAARDPYFVWGRDRAMLAQLVTLAQHNGRTAVSDAARASRLRRTHSKVFRYTPVGRA